MSHCHRATKSDLSALGPLPYAGWRGDQSLTLLTNSQGGSLWPHDQPSNVAQGRTPLFRCPSCPLELPTSSIKEATRGEKPCDTPVLLWLLGSWGSETLCSQLVTGEQPLRIRTEIPGPPTRTSCFHSVFSLAPSLLCVQMSVFLPPSLYLFYFLAGHGQLLVAAFP